MTRAPVQRLRDRSEAEVLREVMRYLALRPDIFWWRANTGAMKVDGRSIRFGTNGCADIIGCYNGRFVSIEVKSSTGKLSMAQVSFRNTVAMHGGLTILARSVEDVRKGLENQE